MKSNIDLLQEAIQRTERQLDNQSEIVKFQWEIVTHKLRPGTMLADMFNSVKGETQVKSGIIESALSLAGGFFSKKLIMGNSNTLWKKLLGYGIQYVSTKFLASKIHVNLPGTN